MYTFPLASAQMAFPNSLAPVTDWPKPARNVQACENACVEKNNATAIKAAKHKDVEDKVFFILND
jgi:hypothetical protein